MDAYLGNQEVDRRSQGSGCRTLPAEPAGIRPQSRGRFQDGNGCKKLLDLARVTLGHGPEQLEEDGLAGDNLGAANDSSSSKRALSAAGVRCLK